jgi:1,2-phenylacetyl-CoA epoxidase PaaB subunit
MPHILGMPKRKSKLLPWQVIAITASPARMYGVVHAADEESALAKAIEEFQIKSPHEQKKFMVRPQR